MNLFDVFFIKEDREKLLIKGSASILFHLVGDQHQVVAIRCAILSLDQQKQSQPSLLLANCPNRTLFQHLYYFPLAENAFLILGLVGNNHLPILWRLELPHEHITTIHLPVHYHVTITPIPSDIQQVLLATILKMLKLQLI